MQLIEAYDKNGEHLGDQFISLEGLQKDTKTGIIQLMFLDEALEAATSHLNQDGCTNKTDLTQD